MSSQPKTDGMAYEAAGSKKVDGRAFALKAAERVGTPSLLWLLVKRHKVGILAIGNIVLVLNFVLPEWPQMVLGLFGK